MDNAETIGWLLGAGTGGLLLRELLGSLVKYWTGATSRQRIRNTDLVGQRDAAVSAAEDERDRATREQQRADREARNRNLAQDYAAHLRRVALDAGVPPTALPDPPRYHRAPATD